MPIRNLTLLVFICFSSIFYAQESISELLKKYNNETIPYISVQELALPDEEVIILDTREIKEYNTSHLQNALHVGYDFFDMASILENIKDKSSKIVVYCSVGIRSEDIAEKLKKEGYTNIYNLFGGIFEWKNNDFIVYDEHNQPTENVHTFSKKWSSWLIKGNKIYD